MNTYVDELVLPVGYEMDVFDPNVGEDTKVRIRVTSSGWKEKDACACNNRYFDMFEAKVIEGLEPGRIIRGYTEAFGQHDQECGNIRAFILPGKDFDPVKIQVRLAREGKLDATDDYIAALEHVMTLRKELRGRVWDETHQRQVQPFTSSRTRYYHRSCGNSTHPASGWVGSTPGSKIDHDGRLVTDMTIDCGCEALYLEDYTVFREGGSNRVLVTQDASVDRVEECFRGELSYS